MAMALPLDRKYFHETEGAIVRGEYSVLDGHRKFLHSRGEQEEVDYYSAEEMEELLEQADEKLAGALGEACAISVCELDTLQAALLIQAERVDADDAGAKPVLALNFANAFRAAGNLFIGPRAQEGEMCRRSTLFASISSFEARGYFDANSDLGGSLYTHGLLVSPCVEVFREIDYTTMPTPVVVAFVSASAPTAKSLKGVSDDELFEVLKTRIQGILAVAAQDGYKHLVLGAWGCGSNCNDPAMMARAFHEALDAPLAGSAYANLFDTVTFAIIDSAKGQPNLAAFRAEFEK